MKKLSRIVTLFLALALVLSVSAVALADPITSTAGETKECVVKINVGLTPFVEWTYPSEIIIKVPVGTGDPVLAESYAIEVSDALIKTSQKVTFGVCEFDAYQTVGFSENAPLRDAGFKLAAEGESDFATSATINDLMGSSGWKISVTLYDFHRNLDWQSGVYGHVILDDAVSGYEATSPLYFCVKFEEEN